VFPGQSIQTAVNNNVGSTTFCIRAGTHTVQASIRPKTGNTFVGEYGAILDGTGWMTSDPEAGAFRAHNEDIDYVTIKNLVIKNMPRKGIHAYYWMADHWTVENNEISGCHTGIEFAPDFMIRNNYIHHNMSATPYAYLAAERGGGYAASHADRAVFENNDISYNGQEQKVLLSTGVKFLNNFVHHNLGDGIWYDSNYTAQALVEGNLVEDNGRAGIDIEAVNGAIVRNNTIRRNLDDGVFIFRSQYIQTYNNLLDSNLGGVEYYFICETLLPGEALQNNATYDNTIIISSAYSSTWGAGLTLHNCDSTQAAPYLNGSKNLTFSRNTYIVPSTSNRYWLWGGGWKSWSEWQAIGQDIGGSMSQ
jgi:parallel beta-helix repeat protein